MSGLARNSSTLKLISKNGKLCTKCCNVGIPCTHCDVPTPLTVFVQIGGLVDFLEGLCLCIDYVTGSAPSKFEGIAADDVINNVIVECTQVSACRWVGFIILDAATLKKYSGASCPLGPPDCTGSVLQTRKMCSLQFEVQRNAADTEVKVLILGEDDPGDFPPACGEVWHSQAVRENITCDGGECICCEKEGLAAVARYWDGTNATIRTWSLFCQTMHVNAVTASANAGGCGGDEEKIQVDVTIHDSDDNLLDNANVEITITGGVEDIVNVNTDAIGEAQYLSDCLCIDDTINIEVTNVTKGGFLWDPDDDEDSLTDSIIMDCT